MSAKKKIDGTITIKARALAAIARWASSDETRPHISCVRLDDHELVACDGHRLVRVPALIAYEGKWTGPVAYLPRPQIMAAVAAQLARRGPDEVAYDDDGEPISKSYSELRLSLADGRAALADVDAAHIEHLQVSWRHVEQSYPPIDQVMVEKPGAEPPGPRWFNPKLLHDMSELLVAFGLSSSVEIAGWTNEPTGPFQFRGPSGVRFVVMPMRMP